MFPKINSEAEFSLRETNSKKNLVVEAGDLQTKRILSVYLAPCWFWEHLAWTRWPRVFSMGERQQRRNRSSWRWGWSSSCHCWTCSWCCSRWQQTFWQQVRSVQLLGAGGCLISQILFLLSGLSQVFSCSSENCRQSFHKNLIKLLCLKAVLLGVFPSYLYFLVY